MFDDGLDETERLLQVLAAVGIGVLVIDIVVALLLARRSGLRRLHAFVLAFATVVAVEIVVVVAIRIMQGDVTGYDLVWGAAATVVVCAGVLLLSRRA
jgi:hypothetical protein